MKNKNKVNLSSKVIGKLVVEVDDLKKDKDIAYFERNMLVILLAEIVNNPNHKLNGDCGWYNDIENNFEGFKRVVSILDGKACFHIPDDLDIGELKEIKPNWDGNTTEQKWKTIKSICGCKNV